MQCHFHDVIISAKNTEKNAKNAEKNENTNLSLLLIIIYIGLQNLCLLSFERYLDV